MPWRGRSFEVLRNIAEAAHVREEWPEYASFCTVYEKGLRKDAFVHLERFLCQIERAPFAERKTFISWLLHRAEGQDGRDMLLPHPLRIRLLEPTLLEWTLVEPACAEPHRWLGDHEHLQRAVELNPCDELARLKLVNSLVARVTWSTHELPYGYLGVAHEDFASLDEAEALLKGVSKEKDRVVWDAEITEQRELIAAYLRSKDDPKA